MDDAMQEVKELGEAMPSAPVAPAHGIAAIALTLAMKYTDIATVQDGTLYQQYKLEGKNMAPLHLDMVFETAIRIEQHLIASEKRIQDIIIGALVVQITDDEADKIVESAPGNEESD